LSNGLQSILIGAPAISTFLLIFHHQLLTLAVDAAKFQIPDLVAVTLCASIVVACPLEILFTLAQRQRALTFGRVPFELVRQRIEEWETPEQIWAPGDISAWTTALVSEAIEDPMVLSLSWLTNTHPPAVLKNLKTETLASLLMPPSLASGDCFAQETGRDSTGGIDAMTSFLPDS
jgi:hypothetical protein